MEEKLAAYRRKKALDMKNQGKDLQDQNDYVVPKDLQDQNQSSILRKKEGQSAIGRFLEALVDLKGVKAALSLLSTGHWQTVLKVCIWICLFTFFISQGFGAVFIVISGFYIIYTSMTSGSRLANEPSAYSVFNEGFERLDGTFTAEQFESELKGGLVPQR